MDGSQANPSAPGAPVRAGPLPAYRTLVASHALGPDAAQDAAASRLQALWERLRAPDPAPRNGGLLARLLGRPAGPSPRGPDRGLYLVGEVGRGKSMLMDLFFEQAALPRKRRIHFHRFMQEAHARIHEWKRANPQGEDPIPPLADRIAAEAPLLCFDEFQVNDIADAMILGRLFQALFDRGVTVVATSNTAPGDLFIGQPGRDAFLPFIALLERHLEIVALANGLDWRRERLQSLGTWHVPANARADAALDDAFTTLAEGAAPAPERLTVNGRVLTVPLAARRVARFDFRALCEEPLGPGDYLALATRFEALVLDGIPRLSFGNSSAARRFITLIDALYDHRVKLVASAATAPDALYGTGDDARMFLRTASRLVEMQSEAYLALPHIA